MAIAFGSTAVLVYLAHVALGHGSRSFQEETTGSPAGVDPSGVSAAACALTLFVAWKLGDLRHASSVAGLALVSGGAGSAAGSLPFAVFVLMTGLLPFFSAVLFDAGRASLIRRAECLREAHDFERSLRAREELRERLEERVRLAQQALFELKVQRAGSDMAVRRLGWLGEEATARGSQRGVARGRGACPGAGGTARGARGGPARLPEGGRAELGTSVQGTRAPASSCSRRRARSTGPGLPGGRPSHARASHSYCSPLIGCTSGERLEPVHASVVCPVEGERACPAAERARRLRPLGPRLPASAGVDVLGLGRRRRRYAAQRSSPPASPSGWGPGVMEAKAAFLREGRRRAAEGGGAVPPGCVADGGTCWERRGPWRRSAMAT